MAREDSPGTTEPLLNGDGASETTVQVDELITGGHGSFHERQDGESIPDER